MKNITNAQTILEAIKMDALAASLRGRELVTTREDLEMVAANFTTVHSLVEVGGYKAEILIGAAPDGEIQALLRVTRKVLPAALKFALNDLDLTEDDLDSIDSLSVDAPRFYRPNIKVRRDGIQDTAWLVRFCLLPMIAPLCDYSSDVGYGEITYLLDSKEQLEIAVGIFEEFCSIHDDYDDAAENLKTIAMRYLSGQELVAMQARIRLTENLRNAEHLDAGLKDEDEEAVKLLESHGHAVMVIPRRNTKGMDLDRIADIAIAEANSFLSDRCSRFIELG